MALTGGCKRLPSHPSLQVPRSGLQVLQVVKCASIYPRSRVRQRQCSQPKARLVLRLEAQTVNAPITACSCCPHPVTQGPSLDRNTVLSFCLEPPRRPRTLEPDAPDSSLAAGPSHEDQSTTPSAAFGTVQHEDGQDEGTQHPQPSRRCNSSTARRRSPSERTDTAVRSAHGSIGTCGLMPKNLSLQDL